MPKDVELARNLVAHLESNYSGLADNVEFTYDTYLEFDKMEAEEPYCKISTNSYEDERVSRNDWVEHCQLTLTLVSRAASTDSEDSIDAWLDKWDQLIRELRSATIDGNKILRVDRDERYDEDHFHNRRRLVTQATIVFRILK